MSQVKEIKLPSGAVLKVYPSPFADAKDLYQALLAELKRVKVSRDMDMGSLFKTFFCAGFSSKNIEEKLAKCMSRCTYNAGSGDLKIDEDTFEPVERRQDYLSVCVEVAKANVYPFMKSLYAHWVEATEMASKGLGETSQA